MKNHVFLFLFLFPHKVAHALGITVFENYLYLTGMMNQSIVRINKFDSNDHKTITGKEGARTVLVYHRQRQPDGKCFPEKPLSGITK
jgi:hypothetical protein